MSWNLTAEQRALQAKARRLAEEVFAPLAAEIDRSEQYPWESARLLNQHGLMGMTIPRELGGQGRSYFDAVLVIEQIARVCGVTARIVVESNMGAISAVMQYGTAEQKRLGADYILAHADKPAICITEPGAGSAANELTTRAERRGNGWVLNGRKHWITGAGVSRLHLIFARAYDTDGKELGIAGFLAVRDETPGLAIGRREPTMGLRAIPEAEVIMTDMAVGDDALVLPPGGFARGFAELMEAYNSQRLGAATIALGIATGAYEHALDYAQRREQFGRPICEFQGIQWMLVDMETSIAAAQALIYKAAMSTGADGASPFPDVKLAAQAKIFASEMAVKTTNDALQVFGAAGYSRNNPVERMVRDARMFTIGGGTAQILRTVVASRLLNRKLPQTRDGYLREAGKA
ncbi:MAG: acyl-CoA dehydrogenase family protein [Alphaproteobacteria bacterium]|nr:acyl-CoA dehydrogenase family protein [Alphaproteobacteria bacterium]